MGPLGGVTSLGPQALPGPIILQCRSLNSLKHFMSTLYCHRLLSYLPAAASQPCFRALDGLPAVEEADSYSRAASPGPHSTETLFGVVGPVQTLLPPLLRPRQCLRTTWVYLGSAGCMENVIITQELRVPFSAYSGPSPWMLQSVMEQGSPSCSLTTKGSREVSSVREMTYSAYKGAMVSLTAGAEGEGDWGSRLCHSPHSLGLHSTDARHLLFNLGIWKF